MGKNKIGILNETSLHAAIKKFYAKGNKGIEKQIDGFYVDIISGKQIIEIQTGYFYSIRKKLLALLKKYKVKLVYPLIVKKYIIVLDKAGEKILYQRKSPKTQSLIDIVDALLIAQYYVGLSPANFDASVADVDGNGAVDIIDALLIAQYYVGLISSFPV